MGLRWIMPAAAVIAAIVLGWDAGPAIGRSALDSVSHGVSLELGGVRLTWAPPDSGRASALVQIEAGGRRYTGVIGDSGGEAPGKGHVEAPGCVAGIR